MQHRALLAVPMVLALFVLPAVGQNAEAPDPAPGNNILYAAHSDEEDDASDSMFEGWMNTDRNDTDNSGGVLGADTQECILVVCPEPDAVDWTWNFTLDPGLRDDVYLNRSENLTFVIHLGSEGGAGEDVEVTSELVQAGVVIATATGMHTYESPAEDGDDYPPLELNTTAERSLLRGGEPVYWTIRAVSDGGAESDLQLSVGEDRGHTRIVLPIQATVFEVVHHEVTDPVFNVTASQGTLHNITHLYNWTTESSNLTLRVDGDAPNGTAHVLVLDAANFTVFEESFNSTDFPDIDRTVIGEPGNWTINITLERFVGNVTLQIDPSDGSPRRGNNTTAPPPTPPAGPGNTTDADADGAGGDEDTPGLAPVAVLTILVALAAFLRRKR